MLTMPLSPPTGHHTAQKIKLIAWTTVGMSESPYSGVQQVYQWPGEGWKLDVSLPPMKMPDAEYWVAFLVALRGRAGTFLFGDTARKTPQGVATGTPLIDVPVPSMGVFAIGASALSLAIAIGDCVVIFSNSHIGTAHTVIDDGGNTYVKVGSDQTHTGLGDCWICLAATATATQVNMTPSDVYSSMSGGTFKNVTGLGAVHVSTGTGAAVSDSLTTTKDHSIVVSGVQGFDGGLVTFTTTLGTQKAIRNGSSTVPLAVILADTYSNAGTTATHSGTVPATTAWQQWSIELLGSGAVPAGRTLLPVRGFTPSVTGIMKAGDYLQLTASGFPQRLYKILTDANSDSSGYATFDIFPRLREPVPDGTAIITATARGTFRLATNQQEWDIDSAKVYGIAFSAIEAL